MLCLLNDKCIDINFIIQTEAGDTVESVANGDTNGDDTTGLYKVPYTTAHMCFINCLTLG